MTGLTRAAPMTAREVAELLNVPVSTVLEWGRRGTLPRVKLGRHVRFIRAHVEAAILAAECGNGADRDADWSAQLVRPDSENGARRP
jgi:excisionase family DNA binding protein